MSNIVLGGVPVELSSDIGRQFVVDCTRAGEGLITDKELAESYEILPADWQNIAKDAALGRAIRAERDRRVRFGVAAREAAAKNLVKGQGILDRIMSDEQTNVRYRIAAITETRQTATPESPNNPSQSDMFHIVINLGSDTEVYSKPIAIGVEDDAQPKLVARPKLTVLSNDGVPDNE